MKKTQNVREGICKDAPRRRKELALALCVSLWMAGGSVEAATSKDVYIDVDASNAIHIDDGAPGGAVTPPGGTATALTVTGDWPTTDWWNIYGGKSANGADVTNYSVTLDGAKNVYNVYGGCSTNDKANNNIVTLKNGSVVRNNVYGGYITGAGQTRDNQVFLMGCEVGGAVYGGNSSTTGNKLYLSGENKVGTLVSFESIYITDAAWGTPVLTMNYAINGEPEIHTENIAFSNVSALSAGQTTILIKNKMANYPAEKIFSGKYTVGTTLEGTGTASVSGNDLIYTIDTPENNNGGGPTAREQTHNTVMGAEVGMAALSVGNDFVGAATEGLSLSANTGADGVSSFARMGGGSMRQETGSHIDSHTWNAIIALGHQNKKARGTFEYGAFFEYGTGNYTTYAEGGLRGDGSSRYTGGGLLAKYTTKDSVYVEGSLRAGSIHDDARNVLRDGFGNPYSYETNAPYFGFHLGVGKEIVLDDIHSVDVYGKYFFNRKNGVSFDAGGHYDLDAVTSSVIRVGARYTVKRDKWNFYGGLAYEHELDGKATGTADGVEIRGADTSGGSVRAEIGATMKPDKNSPITLDFNSSGFAGKKQGFSGGVSVTFMF